LTQVNEAIAPRRQKQTMSRLTIRSILAGLSAAAPFALFAGVSAVMAARHAASLFPFGTQLCGHAPMLHCAWCLASPAGAAMAAAAFVVAARNGRPAAIVARQD
jgi:hypothetical protein